MYYSEPVYPKVELARMTWPEVKQRVEEDPMTPVVVLFSSTEQHGYHLPVNTDQHTTSYTWMNATKIVKDDVKPVLTPLVPFGNEWEHMAFPGTITLSVRTLADVTKQIIESLYNAGFRKFAIIPGCGGQGHNMAFRLAMCELYEQFGPDIILFLGTGRGAFRTAEEAAETNKKLGYTPTPTFTGHGGESETATALFLHPEDVNMDKAVDTIAPGTNQPILPEWVNLPEGTNWEWFVRHFSPTTNWAFPRFNERGPQVGPVGSIGYATKGTARQGEVAMKASVEEAVRFLRWFKKLKITPKPEPKHRYV